MSKLNHLLMDYTGLLFECPVKERLHTCAFASLRQLGAKERYEVWKGLTSDERNKLIDHHHICLAQREHIDGGGKQNATVKREVR